MEETQVVSQCHLTELLPVLFLYLSSLSLRRADLCVFVLGDTREGERCLIASNKTDPALIFFLTSTQHFNLTQSQINIKQLKTPLLCLNFYLLSILSSTLMISSQEEEAE